MIADQSILLVDDDESIRTSMTYFFQKKTRRFSAVPSAEAAMTLLQQESDWDAVISDFKLPGMDGLEFLRRIKHRLPGTKTALITAYASMDVVTDALRAGIHDFIPKPFKAGMVADAIQRMTGNTPETPDAVVPREAAGEERQDDSWRGDLEFTIQKVTHQMNNAFTALRGKAELGLLKTPRAEATDKFADILEILASVEALNKELMSFGKALTRRPFTAVDVMDLIRERTLAHTPRFHAVGARLTIKDAEGGPFLVSTCSEPLTHILDNILINAVHGVSEVTERNREITVEVFSRGERIVLRISDNGIGMDPDTLAKSCLNGFTTKPDGNGLGLFITKRLCRIIMASMHMESRRGQGTTVTLDLGRYRAPEGEAW